MSGITHSKDSFYGEVQPERMPLAEELQAHWRAWVKGGVLCSEMEAAALFVICSILRQRAGGLMVAVKDSHPGVETDLPRRCRRPASAHRPG